MKEVMFSFVSASSSPGTKPLSPSRACSETVGAMTPLNWRTLGEDLATVLGVINQGTKTPSLPSSGPGAPAMSFDQIVRGVRSCAVGQMPLYRLMQSLTTLVAMNYVRAQEP